MYQDSNQSKADAYHFRRFVEGPLIERFDDPLASVSDEEDLFR